MKAFKTIAVMSALGLSLAAPLSASAAVDVTFADPAKFTDATPDGFGSDKARDRVLTQLRSHIEKQAARALKPGQDLKVEVLDVDLAGRVEWWNARFNDVRILRDIDSPAIKLRYTLTEGGRTLASGEERVTDLGYLWGSNPWIGSSQELRYEKAMLSDWLRKRIAPASAAG